MHKSTVLIISTNLRKYAVHSIIGHAHFIFYLTPAEWDFNYITFW